MSITKIIHQIWFQGGDKIPDKYKGNINKIKNVNPEWKYVLWDNDTILNLISDNIIVYETYNKLKYMHQKIDFAKYIILYAFGGIYIDMDAYTIKHLDELINNYLDYDLIVSKLNCNVVENIIHCQHNFCINNGVIYAKPGCVVLNDMVKFVIDNHGCIVDNDMICIELTTGPKAFTDIVMDNINSGVKVLEPEVLEPCIIDNCNVTENTYVIHSHNNTWIGDGVKGIFRWYVRYKWLIYLIGIILFIWWFWKNKSVL